MREPIDGKTPGLSVWEQSPRFAYKKVLGWERRDRQPSGRLTDGSTVSKC